MSTVVYERSMGRIYVTVRLVAESRLKLTARVVLSSENLFDGDIGAVMTCKFLAGVAIGGAMRAITNSWNWRK